MTICWTKIARRAYPALMKAALLYSYQLGGDQLGVPASASEIAELLAAETLAWAHLDVKHSDTKAFLKANLNGLDPSIFEALMEDETRPRATEVGDGFLIILRGINTAKNEAAENLVSVRLWIDARRVISMQRKKVQAVDDMAALIDTGKTPTGAGQFLEELVDNLTRRMEPVLSRLDDETDAIEEKLVTGDIADLRAQLVALRKRTIGLRRYLGPQRDALSHLAKGRVDWLTEQDRRSLVESHDRLQRMVEDMDALRERSQIIKDELANAMADRMNRNMYVLALIGAVFLPLGFLTGLMGVNIGGVPGVGSGSAFWVFAGILVLFVAAELALFRFLKWI